MMKVPDCMDGGRMAPCEGYAELEKQVATLYAENKALRGDLPLASPEVLAADLSRVQADNRVLRGQLAGVSLHVLALGKVLDAKGIGK